MLHSQRTRTPAEEKRGRTAEAYSRELAQRAGLGVRHGKRGVDLAGADTLSRGRERNYGASRTLVRAHRQFLE